MQKFNDFMFEKFDFDSLNLIAKFYYSFDEKQKFVEKIDFQNTFFIKRKDFDENIFSNFLFSLFLACGISYYKLFPTNNLIIKDFYLDDEDLDFWKKFYINGLGEFFYKNHINPNGLCNFISTGNKKLEKKNFKQNSKILLPIGGGKDSLVSAEILKNSNFQFTPFIFGKIDVVKHNCIKIINGKEILIKREIDHSLFRLNNEGYYNGHIPITGIISFVLLATAYLYDYRYIILSNEKSANSGNTKLEFQNNYLDKLKSLEVNHQYSKSLEFEKDLNNYIKRNLSDELIYFSLLRGMYEIKIAEIFSKIGKKYFQVFSSCNKNFIINEESQKNFYSKYWCLDCPKCAFVYTILKVFLSNNEILKIFSKEMYEDKKQENLFKELLGIQGIKPFECVGEKEEVVFAMQKTINNLKNEKKELPIILKNLEEKIKLNDIEFANLEKRLFKNYMDETFLPDEFKTIVSRYFKQ